MAKSDYKLDGINIEVTNCCPLRCPQCYCTLEGGKHIPIERIRCILEEAAQMGLTHVEYSGGETLCYPHIYEAIEIATHYGLSTSISLSGWGFNEQTYDKLIKAGISAIHISLNAASEELNALTRDGYDLSIAALRLLKEKKFPNTTINWVMHRQTVDELPKMLALAEDYGAASILIIDPKPNSKNELFTYPTADQIRSVAQIIKKNRSQVELEVHHCFSPLAALVGENKLWGNLNRCVYQGCTAGLCSMSVSVDGNFLPCRHLDYPEAMESISTYWNNSTLLNSIRDLDTCRRKPCCECRFMNYCRHCLAINAKLNNELYIGNEFCPIYEEKQGSN